MALHVSILSQFIGGFLHSTVVNDHTGGLRVHIPDILLLLWPGIFWFQLRALLWKNWIVVSKHAIFTLSILRCFIFPIAFEVFLATAQAFLIKPKQHALLYSQSLPYR